MIPGANLSSNSSEKCDQCQSYYSFMKKKKICNICQQPFCKTCAPRIRVADQSYHCCQICQLISNPTTSDEQLLSIKVKHLRCFLQAKRIAHDRCTEKKDFIELIRQNQQVPFIHQQAQSGGSSSNSDDAFSIFTSPISNLAANVQSLFSNASEALTSFASEASSPSSSRPVPNERRRRTTPPQPTPPPQRSASQRASSQRSSSAQPQTNDVNVPTNQTTRNQRKSLSEIASEEHIEALSSRELKEILAGNFVDYKGCVEKSELVEKVRRLYRDHECERTRISGQNIEQSMSNDNDLCKICLDAVADCVFLDCGHMVTCVRCGKQMAECPICRAHIIRVVRVFKS